ncbi:hypothetical protein [Streptomyces sp. NPDC001286]
MSASPDVQGRQQDEHDGHHGEQPVREDHGDGKVPLSGHTLPGSGRGGGLRAVDRDPSGICWVEW